MLKSKYYIVYVALGIVLMANYRGKNPLDTIQDAFIFSLGVSLLIFGLYLRMRFRRNNNQIDDFKEKSK